MEEGGRDGGRDGGREGRREGGGGRGEGGRGGGGRERGPTSVPSHTLAVSAEPCQSQT